MTSSRTIATRRSPNCKRSAKLSTTFDAVALGVCRFDGEGRLVLSNRRYGEIYRLAPEQVRPGATPPEIAELRAAAGTAAMTGDADLASAPSIHATAAANTWTEALEGRAAWSKSFASRARRRLGGDA
jgi:PAS domain-containing protein